MLKKGVVLSLLLMVLISGVSVVRTNVNADEKDGCIALEDGTIVCEEDLTEGCRINEELSIVECEIDLHDDHDVKVPKE